MRLGLSLDVATFSAGRWLGSDGESRSGSFGDVIHDIMMPATRSRGLLRAFFAALTKTPPWRLCMSILQHEAGNTEFYLQAPCLSCLYRCSTHHPCTPAGVSTRRDPPRYECAPFGNLTSVRTQAPIRKFIPDINRLRACPDLGCRSS